MGTDPHNVVLKATMTPITMECNSLMIHFGPGVVNTAQAVIASMVSQEHLTK